MLLRRILWVHALITAAAGIVLFVAPEAIPATVGIRLEGPERLLTYFLGAAELAVAFLSVAGSRLQGQAQWLIVQTLILFHLATAAGELLAMMQGGSQRLWWNVLLRVLVSIILFGCSKR